MFDKLSKVFEGQNPVFDYQFRNSDLAADWEVYRTQILNEPNVWSEKAWEIFKSKINSVMVVDMPTEGKGNPEPYFYFLDFGNVIDYEVNPRTGNMNYIIFRQAEKKIAVIDDKSYSIYEEDKGNNIGALLAENRHKLGYCPARFFWNEDLNIDTPDVKKSPLSIVLEALDNLLFFAISKRHLDLYGSYPIYSGYEQNCDFTNSENGDYCDGGFLKNTSGYYKFDSAGLLCKCPKCGDKRIAGVGSFVEVPIPAEGQPDLRNPVQVLSADVASLDYQVREEDRKRREIERAVIGIDEGVINDQALNELQVSATYEDRNKKINRIKIGFESAQKFIDETVCRLRYGSGFIGCSISYGTNFYPLTTDELRAKKKQAKEDGATEAELDAISEQIIESEYKNNPSKLHRMKVLADLEPLRNKTQKEILELYQNQLISQSEMQLKIHFDELIRRFERENTNVSFFGSEMEYAKKIETIKNTLIDYVNQV